MRRHHGHGQGRVETAISIFLGSFFFFSSPVFALFAASFLTFVFLFFFFSQARKVWGLWGRRRLVHDSTIGSTETRESRKFVKNISDLCPLGYSK